MDMCMLLGTEEMARSHVIPYESERVQVQVQSVLTIVQVMPDHVVLDLRKAFKCDSDYEKLDFAVARRGSSLQL